MSKSDPDFRPTATQTAVSKPRDPANVRSDLIQQVQSGTMTLNEANAEAERLGIAPLITQPDPAKFDPLNKVAWPLPMLAAWLVLGTLTRCGNGRPRIARS